MNSHFKHIKDKLEQRKDDNSFRELKFNNNLVDFCSNDYLGLASEQEIHMLDTIKQFGSTGSRLISGNFKQAVEVEVYLADFYKAESGLIFNSGYTANVGLFSCIAQRSDTIIYDELIHASIRDGIKLSNANSFSFKHNDLLALMNKIKKAKGNVFIAVESIYSMDGDEAPLQKIVEICKEFDAALIVDEAHSCGIFGEKGEGLVVEHGLENDVFARVVTFGKAFGCHGAVVLGNKLLRDYLINYSRSFIYTTALPITAVLTIKSSHQFLLKNLDKIERLRGLISYFKKSIVNNQLSIINSDSPIQCIVVPGNDKVRKLAIDIQNKGIDVRPILAPTVPKGEERLRICLHSFNTEQQVEDLIKLIGDKL